MKKFIIFALAVVTVMGLSMCTENKKAAVVDEPLDSCAVMPEFPGGIEALLSFINDHINYPVQAEEVGLEGKVLCNFVIEKDGSVGQIEVEESVDSLLDAEAVRVLSSIPAWTPGKDENGEAVRVKYTIPIIFVLEGTRNDVDQWPQFPGGVQAYIDFMNSNLKYPAECIEKEVEGRVLVRVTIDEKGNVTDPKVLKAIDPLLDSEALRVVKSMPQWVPGSKEGKSVAASYVIPVTFRLN